MVIGWPLCVDSPAAIADWADANPEVVRAQSEMWWDGQERLYGDVHQFMVKWGIL